MIRSLLFIPGNQPNMIQNADLFDADVIIFDLEDAVHPSEKDSARQLVHSFLCDSTEMKAKKYVRINALDSPFYEADLELLIHDPVDAFVLPKACEASVDYLMNYLYHHQRRDIMILPIVEDAKAVLDVHRFVKSEQVLGILLGAEDLSKDLEVARTLESDEIFYARQKVVYACAAYHKLSVDTPFTDVFNDEAFEKDVLKATRLGMKAKSAIHPRHIDFINQTFSPSIEEVRYAKKVLSALEKANELKQGAFSVDGKMIDKPIIERAKRTLEKARDCGMVMDGE